MCLVLPVVAIISAKGHMKFMDEHKNLESQLSRAFSNLQRSFSLGLRKCEVKLNVLNSKIRGDVYQHTCPTQSKTNCGVDNTALTAGMVDGGLLDDSSGNGSKSAGHSSDFMVKSTSNNGANDTHLMLSSYKYLVETYTEHLHALQKGAVTCSTQTNDFSLKIRQIFVTSMQLFCHEKSRICSYNADLMKETSCNFQSWNNAVNVKEFQIQDKKEMEHVRRKSQTMTAMPSLENNIKLQDDENSQQDDDELQGDILNQELELGLMDAKNVNVVPTVPLADLGAGQLLLETNMRFTTFRDAKHISHGELDNVSPTIVSNTSNVHVHFAEKGGLWMMRSSKVDETSSIVVGSGGNMGSPGGQNTASSTAIEKVSKKNRFTSFFSSKVKGNETPAHVMEEDNGNDGDIRNSVGDSAGVVQDETVLDDNVPEVANLYEAHITVSAEGVLHLFGVSCEGGSVKVDQQPLKSLLLEVT